MAMGHTGFPLTISAYTPSPNLLAELDKSFITVPAVVKIEVVIITKLSEQLILKASRVPK